MKDLLLYIARNLVDHPEAVTVTEVPGQEEITLELRVAPEDMGKVIGRQGAHRQGDPHCGTLLCPAHRNQGFRRYCRLNRKGSGLAFAKPLPFLSSKTYPVLYLRKYQ